MATIYYETDINLLSPKYDIDILPAEMRNTYRFYIRYIHARYQSDVDLIFNLWFKRKYDDTEENLTFLMKKEETYLKKPLPPATLVRAFRYGITGQGATQLEIYEAGVMGFPHLIGSR
jgi:hypothetical protein